MTTPPTPPSRSWTGSVIRMLLLGALLVLSLPTGFAWAEPTPPADPALEQTVAADEQRATGPAVVDAGHVDLGPRLVDGQWSVMVRDDSGKTPVWRDPNEVVLVVTDKALLDAPTDPQYSFMGATGGERWYVIPQTQNPDVVWLGWNTQDPGVVSTVQRGATMSIGPVSGPGKSWMFLQNGTFGEPLLLVDGQEDAPQDVWVDVNTHVHANWVFTEPGVYTAALTFSAQTTDGEQLSATTTLRFAVGSTTAPAEALTAAAPQVSDTTPPADPATVGADEEAESAQGPATSQSGALVPAVAAAGAVVVVAVLLLAVRRHRLVAGEQAQARAEADKEQKQ